MVKVMFFYILVIGLMLLGCSDDSATSVSEENVLQNNFDNNIADVPDAAIPNATFVDSRDGKVYRMVTIGSQTWMAQNLNYVSVGGNADNLKGSVCYNFDESMCEKYGRLYNDRAALNLNENQMQDQSFYVRLPNYQGICPDGWHLPTTDDLKMLFYVSASYDVNALMAVGGGDSKDCQMDSKENTEACNMGLIKPYDLYWENATDALGFSMLASGHADCFEPVMENPCFRDLGRHAYFWSVKNDMTSYALVMTDFSGREDIPIGPLSSDGANSIRCLKN